MSNTFPEFSILIPTTGRADIVKLAIGSVLNQTYRNFELVIADSGGATGEIKRLVEKLGDARIRYLPTPLGGPFIPWDYSEAEARGDYILWLDDDNYLLPYALELFRDAVLKTSADIITATHLYYYDNTHPRRFLRNCLGILPFTGKETFIDTREALKSFYTFTKRGPGETLPRFHPSEVLVSRRVTAEARKRLGFVVFHDMPSAHPHPVLFAFAESCYFIDHPMVIIGRLGASMSQTWSTAARRRFQKKLFVPHFSPFSGYTRLNARLENFLTVKHLLPDIMKDISVDYEVFAALYLRELLYLDTDIPIAARNWENFFAFLKSMPSSSTKRLQGEARYLLLLAPFVWTARRLKLHLAWRIIDNWRMRFKERKLPAEAFAKNKEFEIPIDARYGVKSVADLAEHVREIMLEKTGRDIWLDASS